MKTTGFTCVLRITLVQPVDRVVFRLFWRNRVRNEVGAGVGHGKVGDGLFDGSELSTLSSRDSYNLVM
jgi:hypothetical protein